MYSIFNEVGLTLWGFRQLVRNETEFSAVLINSRASNKGFVCLDTILINVNCDNTIKNQADIIQCYGVRWFYVTSFRVTQENGTKT